MLRLNVYLIGAFLSEHAASFPVTQPIPIPQPSSTQPYPQDSVPCNTQCDPTTMSVPYYPSNGGSQNLIPPVNGLAGQPNLVLPPAGFPYYPYLIVPQVESMSGPINLGVAPSSDPSGCDLPNNGTLLLVDSTSICSKFV